MAQSEAFRFQTRIRFIDTDASGRIHYTAMFRYFETAEIEFLRTIGITYALDREYTFPRVHVECDYRLRLGHDDFIEIETRLTRVGRSSFCLEFETFKDGGLAANGAIVIACVDSGTGRSMPLPDNIREKLLSVLQV